MRTQTGHNLFRALTWGLAPTRPVGVCAIITHARRPAAALHPVHGDGEAVYAAKITSPVLGNLSALVSMLVANVIQISVVLAELLKSSILGTVGLL